jgi:hypothetical protein
MVEARLRSGGRHEVHELTPKGPAHLELQGQSHFRAHPPPYLDLTASSLLALDVCGHARARDRTLNDSGSNRNSINDLRSNTHT